MSELLIPIAQIALSVALLLVAVLCLRLDQKLSALRKGNDGVAQTIVQLNEAVARAEVAIKALRAQTHESEHQKLSLLEEQKRSFEASVTRALARPDEPQLTPQTRNQKRERLWDDEDFVPARRANGTNRNWDGLR